MGGSAEFEVIAVCSCGVALESATREATSKQNEITEIMSDLSRYKETMYSQHLNFGLNPDSAASASKNVQNIKESLDAWKDRIREKLEAVDLLCRESADTMPPEQYALLRQKRDQLAADYLDVLNTVQIVQNRLNVLAGLLIEFSTQASSMQSWMTDRTRLGGNIKVKSADPACLEEARREAKSLSEEVVREESRLKAIGSIVLKIEEEIDALYNEAPVQQEKGIHSEEVRNTYRQVEDDYSELMKQCQELIQFQNRVGLLGREQNESARSANDWLSELEKKLAAIENDDSLSAEEKLRLIELLNKQAADEQRRLDDADQAALRLLGALEGAAPPRDVKDKQEEEMRERRKRHDSVVEGIQRGKNAVTAQMAAEEGVRQAVDGLEGWVDLFENKVSNQRDIPMRVEALNQLKGEEQLMRSELESRLALINGLEKEAKGQDALENKLKQAKQRLQRSNSDLKGFRDNVNDALTGVQSLALASDALGRNCDVVAANVRSTNPRDSGRLDDATKDVDELDSQLEKMRDTTKMLKSIPNATETERLDKNINDLQGRVNSVADELEAKRVKQAALGGLESQFEDARKGATDWLHKFDEELKNLGPVSIELPKLKEQRKEVAGLAEKHQQGQPLLEELEGLSMQLAEADATAGNRSSSVPRHALDLLGKYNHQTDELRARAESINKRDQKASEMEEAANGVRNWIGAQQKTLAEQKVPANKDTVRSLLGQLDRMDKSARGEQRRLEEVRLKARELAREATLDGEAENVKKTEAALESDWNALTDDIEAARERARAAEKLLDGCGQMEKWMAAKGRMMEAIGAPSTEAALARSQMGQIQIMKAETEGERAGFNKLNEDANELAAGVKDQSDVQGILDRMDELNKRWNGLEGDLDNKEQMIKKAAELGNDIRKLQKDIKSEIAELEADVDRAGSMPPGELEKQLATLDSLKHRSDGLDDLLTNLDGKMEEAEKLDIDAVNKNDLQEQVAAARKRAHEVDRKIDGVKRAALSAKVEGDELDKQLDELLELVREAAAEVEQAPPISADANRLKDQAEAFAAIYNKLLDKEVDVSVVRSKAADQLKKKPDPEIKAKLDELSKTWAPLLAGTKDKKALLDKVADLVKQFNDLEHHLGEKLEDDQKKLEDILTNEDPAVVCEQLEQLEHGLGRRLADSDALADLGVRIENAAPGADASKLRRKAENLALDWKNLGKKAKAAAANSHRKVDLNDKFNRLASEAHQYVDGQNDELTADSQPAKDRIHNKLTEVSAWWTRKERELRGCGDDLKKVSGEEGVKHVDQTMAEIAEKVEALLARLREEETKLGEKKDTATRAAERTARLAHEANRLLDDIADMDAVGRSHAELARQKSECEEAESGLLEKDKEAEEVLAVWDEALKDGAVPQSQWESNKTAVDDVSKLLGRAKKRLAQRKRKIEQTEQEVNKIESDAAGLIAELDEIRSGEVLSSAVPLADPRGQAEKLKHLKDSLKPVAEKVDGFVSDCKLLIRTAGPEADTHELDGALKNVAEAWSGVQAAVSEREMGVDAAVQQMGRYEDAHRALLNWLEETEEMMENQRPPAADAKVAKAQLHAYDVLMKHIEDKQASMQGFTAMIDKMASAAPSEEEKKLLKKKDTEVWDRYNDLLAAAKDRQARLMETVDLSEKLADTIIPLEAWLTQTEKRVSALGNIPTGSDKVHSQMEELEMLEDDIILKQEDVNRVLGVIPMLCKLVSAEDANGLEAQGNQLANKYKNLSYRTGHMRTLLGELAEQVGEFELDTENLSKWLTNMESKILDLDELAIEPDDLIEQSNILGDLAMEVCERDAMVSSMVNVGLHLSRQTNGDEAVALQNKIEALKLRYADIMSVTDEKIGLLQKAIPLSERFHAGFEGVMLWVEAVEEDLLTIDDGTIEEQAQVILSLEEAIGVWRPEVDDLVGVSNQLQVLSSIDKADELFQNTAEMNRRVNLIADKVSRRAERMDLADKQSRAVLDDLDFLVEWLADVRERVIASGPPSCDPDFVKTQLKNQRLMNDDVTANKARLRDVIAEAKKVARQLGAEGGEANAALIERADLGKELVDEVAALCMDRTEILERAVVLSEQLTNEFDELVSWLDQVDAELRSAPDIHTATPAHEMRAMHEHNTQLAADMTAHKPIVERFEHDVKYLKDICVEEDAVKLGELADDVVARYNELRAAIQARGAVLDSTLDATSGFGERLETFVANLEGAAERLRENNGISSDPAVLEGRLAENTAILDSLRAKQGAYDALKDSAAELLASAPRDDPAAAEVTDKLIRLEKLWKDIELEAANRGQFLEDVLAKAKHFWNELDQCQKAVDDLRVHLDSVEPAAGQPAQLQIQQAALQGVEQEIIKTEPRIAGLRQAGAALAGIIPPEEQAVVEAQVDAVQAGWGTITKLFADKNRDLVSAMEEAMQFHGDLSGLLAWLDGAEAQLVGLPTVGQISAEDIPAHLDDLHHFREEADQHGVMKEQLCHTAAQIAAGVPAHQAAVVRQPINELNTRWGRLYNTLGDRQQKAERALLQMGRLSEAAEQMIAWMNKTADTLGELETQGPVNLRHVEILLCKLAVIKNDVHSHAPSVETLNAAAQRLVKDESGSATADKIRQMNQKWAELHATLDRLDKQLVQNKSEAENVGGELERLLGWLEDVEVQLATTKPTGGLPETAEAQMDDFLVLKAEVDQNTPTLVAFIRDTDRYLEEHGNDANSWIGKNHAQIRNKWSKVKELCADRGKKLELALEEAIALDASMKETAQWLTAAEAKLASQAPVSRLPDPLATQIEEQEAWMDEVALRKQQMADQQAKGTRLQYYCEKKDAIPIKNGLVSLKHRFEKIASRSADRTKQLKAASDEVQQWLSGVVELEEWMDGMEGIMAEDTAHTSSVDRLKQQLEAIKEAQKELHQRQAQYDLARKRGIALSEHAPKSEAKTILARNDALAKRWNALSAKSNQKHQAAEHAVLEGGEFEDSMNSLEEWVDGELKRIENENQRVHGDVETVKGLKEEEKKRDTERKQKKQGVDTVLRKAEDLVSRGVEEAPSVEAARERLKQKWSKVEVYATARAAALADAETEAAAFDDKAHQLLDWLAAEETKLKAVVVDVPSALVIVEQVRAAMEGHKPARDECIAAGRAIQEKQHPRADQPMKNWLRVLDSRWKEVEERLDEREFTLLEEQARETERDAAIKELMEFVALKREELLKMTALPPAQDLDTVGRMQKDHEQMEFDLRERKPEVDAALKGTKRGVKHPRAEQLSSDWQQLWLDFAGHGSSLEGQKALLEEMKRLEGWKWEDWKERYVEWNDHGKARVSDLFRRIDRSHTGNVPRGIFIDAIIASRFPTSRLEMAKVADMFDKGDGMVNSKEFINALRFDANRQEKPKTEYEKINEEIKKQALSCSCCTQYKIEKIGEGRYRFGDTQIKRMVRILRSTVMVRVGGGWEELDEFLGKHDPCRAKGRLNINIYKDVAPSNAIDTMRAFTKGRYAKSPMTQQGTPGPIMKIREKTERSMPMFPQRNAGTRTNSDLSLADSRLGRLSRTNSRGSLMDTPSRPPSRGSDFDPERPTRIPSLRAHKGVRMVPPAPSSISSNPDDYFLLESSSRPPSRSSSDLLENPEQPTRIPSLRGSKAKPPPSH